MSSWQQLARRLFPKNVTFWRRLQQKCWVWLTEAAQTTNVSHDAELFYNISLMKWNRPALFLTCTVWRWRHWRWSYQTNISEVCQHQTGVVSVQDLLARPCRRYVKFFRYYFDHYFRYFRSCCWIVDFVTARFAGLAWFWSMVFCACACPPPSCTAIYGNSI